MPVDPPETVDPRSKTVTDPPETVDPRSEAGAEPSEIGAGLVGAGVIDSGLVEVGPLGDLGLFVRLPRCLSGSLTGTPRNMPV